MSRATTTLPKTVTPFGSPKIETHDQRKRPSGQNQPTRGAKNFDAILVLYPTERGGIVDARQHDLGIICDNVAVF